MKRYQSCALNGCCNCLCSTLLVLTAAVDAVDAAVVLAVASDAAVVTVVAADVASFTVIAYFDAS